MTNDMMTLGEWAEDLAGHTTLSPAEAHHLLSLRGVHWYMDIIQMSEDAMTFAEIECLIINGYRYEMHQWLKRRNMALEYKVIPGTIGYEAAKIGLLQSALARRIQAQLSSFLHPILKIMGVA